MFKLRKLLVLFIVVFSMVSGAYADRGVGEAELLIGMSAAFSGPASALGLGMKTGILSVFNDVNRVGGINGKKLVLKEKDDKYEPNLTAPNMRELTKKDKGVFAVIGNVGTPTAISALPIALETKTPMIGAFTGAGILRKSPPDRYVINYRASYAEETAAMVNGFLDAGIKLNEIAFFTQNDGYGDAGFNGGIKALKKKGLKDVSRIVHGRYVRNTVDVEDAVSVILDSDVEPKAIIMVGAYKPCAQFIKIIKEEGFNPIFANVSFVGSKALASELGDVSAKVVVTQVVPHYMSGVPAAKEYRKLVAEKDRDFVSFEGFLVAKMLIKGLKGIDGEFTREALIDSFEKLNKVDIGTGVNTGLSKGDHQISHSVWPTVLKLGKFVALSSWSNVN